jgi:hypothetical protein
MSWHLYFSYDFFELKIFPEAGKIYFLYDGLDRLRRDLRLKGTSKNWHMARDRRLWING